MRGMSRNVKDAVLTFCGATRFGSGLGLVAGAFMRRRPHGCLRNLRRRTWPNPQTPHRQPARCRQRRSRPTIERSAVSGRGRPASTPGARASRPHPERAAIRLLPAAFNWAIGLSIST